MTPRKVYTDSVRANLWTTEIYKNDKAGQELEGVLPGSEQNLHSLFSIKGVFNVEGVEFNSEVFSSLDIEWFVLSVLIIFIISVFGLIATEGTFLFRLMCYEVIYLLINIIFICCGFLFNDATSYIFVLMLLTLVAAESAIILSLVVLHYNLGGDLKL